MSRKHTRRKYQAASTAWAYAIAANQEMDQAHATSIMVLIRTAFERLKSGAGEDDDFDRLAVSINVGIVRAEAIDPLAVTYMLQGRDALIEADRIMGEHGRYGFTGPALIAIGEALDLYEQILRKSTPRQMELAANESARQMAALKGSA